MEIIKMSTLLDDDFKFLAYDIVDIYMDKWKRKYKNFDGLLDCLSENLVIDIDESEENND
jgi:hypothetical protein